MFYLVNIQLMLSSRYLRSEMMVKKSFITIIFSILLISGLFSKNIQKESAMTVSFEPGSTPSIEFGFSSTPVQNFTSTVETISEYSKELDAENSKEVYAWWRVVSPESFSITLYPQGMLKSEYGLPADWTVSWDVQDGTESVGGIDNYGEAKAKTVYERKVSSSSSFGVVGSEKLNFGLISSDNLPAGEYKGILVMDFSSL